MITRFEDLCNELLCEIFDYLDSCVRYESFAYLNVRLYRLVHDSTLPLTLNFSLLSKAALQHRCNRIVRPNVHRITSLRLSQHLLIEQFFAAVSLDSSFRRLESLTLIDVRADSLIPILTDLASLPRLASLSIACVDEIRSRDFIYFLLIRLSALKYCKLRIDSWNHDAEISLTSTHCSPLEQLVLEMRCTLEELLELLAYTPHLRHLSCKLVTANSSLSEIQPVPVELRSLFLQLEDTSFDEFEWVIDTFSQQLEVLKISTKLDVEFLDASRWEQLISSRMPRLRRFDLRFEMVMDAVLDSSTYQVLKEGFNSLFWREKRWSFAHQSHMTKDANIGITFYSIKPHRWQQYDFYENVNQSRELGTSFASDVRFLDYQTFPTHTLSFPHVRRLTLAKGYSAQLPSFISQLPRLFLSTLLTELIITDEQFRFEHLLSLCGHFPNLQSLTIPKSVLYLSSRQPNSRGPAISRNQFTQVTVTDQCSVDDVQILLRFCPDLRSLQIEVDPDHLPYVLYFLLRKQIGISQQSDRPPLPYYESFPFGKREHVKCMRCTRNQGFRSSQFDLPCNHQLSSLCVRNTKFKTVKKVQTLIDCQALLANYSIEYLDQKMYLWW